MMYSFLQWILKWTGICIYALVGYIWVHIGARIISKEVPELYQINPSDCAVAAVPFLIVGSRFYGAWRNPQMSLFRICVTFVFSIFLFFPGTYGAILALGPLGARFHFDHALYVRMLVYFIVIIATLIPIIALPPTMSSVFLRGRRIFSFKEAKHRAAAITKGLKKTLFWGGVDLPEESSEGHFATIGTTRSGKTLTIRLLLQSLFSDDPSLTDKRGLVYDPKGEFYPILRGMGIPRSRIKNLSPLDARSVAWDISTDVKTPAAAEMLAAILIPASKNDNNRYFYDAARQLTRGAIDSLILASQNNHGSRWTFRDLVMILSDETQLRRALTTFDHTKGMYDRFRRKASGTMAVRSTLETCISPYRIVAALWEHADTRISLNEWVAGSDILLLSTDQTLKETVQPIYRVMFQFVVQLLLGQRPDAAKVRSWIVLDEARMAGELREVPALLTMGAGLGVRFVLGFQDYDGMCDVHGKHGAEEVIGLCSTKAFFRLDSASSALWASNTIGTAEIREWGETIGKDGSNFTEHKTQRQLVLPTELQTLPFPDANGIAGYFITPTVGTYRATVPFVNRIAPLFDEALIRRPPDQQYCSPWTDDDWKRLGFMNKTKPASEPKKTEEPPKQPLPTLLDAIPRLEG